MKLIKWLQETFSPYHNEVWSRKQARDEFAKKQGCMHKAIYKLTGNDEEYTICAKCGIEL